MGRRKKSCVDCGTDISRGGTRCNSCALKVRWERGDFGKRREPNYCIDCGTGIWPGAVRCASCATRHRWECGVFAGLYVPPNFCVDCGAKIDTRSTHCQSCATKAAWARGDYDSEEYRHKLTKAMEARWERDDFANVLSQRLSEAGRHKISEGVKAAWKRGDFDGVFQSPTSIELQIAAALDIMGIEHEIQYRPEGCRWPFDEFVLPNVLIEIQGDWWHSDNFPEQRNRDAKKAQWAVENGFEFMEIWEHEIKEYGAWAIIAQRCG